DEVDHEIAADVRETLTRGREREACERGRDVVSAAGQVRETVTAARVGLRAGRAKGAVNRDGHTADRIAVNGRHHAAQVDRTRARVAVEYAVLVAVNAEPAACADRHAFEGQLRARAGRIKQLLRGHGRRARAVG